jgi:hypothetical protein
MLQRLGGDLKIWGANTSGSLRSIFGRNFWQFWYKAGGKISGSESGDKSPDLASIVKALQAKVASLEENQKVATAAGKNAGTQKGSKRPCDVSSETSEMFLIIINTYVTIHHLTSSMVCHHAIIIINTYETIHYSTSSMVCYHAIIIINTYIIQQVAC